MQTHENTEETGILLGKNSGVSISTHKIFESVSGEKLYNYYDAVDLRRVGVDVNEDDSICTLAGEDCSMRTFVFIKSPDLDNNFHYDFDKFYPNIKNILRFKTIGYVSAHDDKVIKTSGLVIYAKCDGENFDSRSFAKMTSQEKIKYLEDNGYEKFKLVCSERGEGNNKLKLVDAKNPATIVQQGILENLGGVLRNNSTEYVTDDQFEGKIQCGTEFHLNDPGSNSCTSYTLFSNTKTDSKKIVILGQKTGFAFSDFHEKSDWLRLLRSLGFMCGQPSIFSKPTTFYIPFKGKALTDILSYCADNKIDYEKLNITIVIMNPEICEGFQTIIDDIRNQTTIDQYLERQKLSNGKNCFVKFKLSDLTKDNITKILDRQKNKDETFGNFINDVSQDSFCEIIYQSKVAGFLVKYLPNWLFKFLNWLFNFEKIKIGLQLTEGNDTQKSISPINNQYNSIVNKPSNENNDRSVNENHINESLKEQSNPQKSALPIGNQDNSIVNEPSNENNDRLVNENHINKSLKEQSNPQKSALPINNQDDSIINKTSNENGAETPLLDKQANGNII